MTESASDATALRALGWGRLAFGALSLLALGRRDVVHRADLPPLAVLAARALAVRDLSQGALLVSRPEPAMARVGTVIDVLHASSMLPVVALAPSYRRAAAVSAGVAAAWVGLSEAALRRGTR
ncbi:MAG: hypothetical protein ACXV2H_04650 [Actinomycetes bacterium]